MSRKAAFLAERFAADLTLVGFLSCVNTQVFPHVTFIPHCFIAESTFVDLSERVSVSATIGQIVYTTTVSGSKSHKAQPVCKKNIEIIYLV